jgi:DNA-binding transcriptional regulator YdaS (Cro superfamily)
LGVDTALPLGAIITPMVETTRIELDALKQAIDAAGSQSELARLLGVSTTSVWKMVNNAKRMSAEFVLKAEQATGVSRHDLRPDLYPRESHPSCKGQDKAPPENALAGGASSSRNALEGVNP